jgi:hypothetical protein
VICPASNSTRTRRHTSVVEKRPRFHISLASRVQPSGSSRGSSHTGAASSSADSSPRATCESQM